MPGRGEWGWNSITLQPLQYPEDQLHVSCGQGSVLLWCHCSMLCISSFVKTSYFPTTDPTVQAMSRVTVPVTNDRITLGRIMHQSISISFLANFGFGRRTFFRRTVYVCSSDTGSCLQWNAMIEPDCSAVSSARNKFSVPLSAWYMHRHNAQTAMTALKCTSGKCRSDNVWKAVGKILQTVLSYDNIFIVYTHDV